MPIYVHTYIRTCLYSDYFLVSTSSYTPSPKLGLAIDLGLSPFEWSKSAYMKWVVAVTVVEEMIYEQQDTYICIID